MKLFLFLCFICFQLRAEEPQKYQLSACAFFQNEAPFLKEWIEYHKLLGVEHFYLYNSASNDEFKKILTPYIRKGIVTLTQWPVIVAEDKDDPQMWMLSTKIPAYENAAVYLAKDKTKWLVFLDIAEFLLPIEKDRLSEILARYQDHPAIVLPKWCYEAFNLDRAPARKFVIESVEMTAPPYENIQGCVEKMIFRPECYAGFQWPPYMIVFKEGKGPAYIQSSEMRINRYLNRFKGHIPFNPTKLKMNIDHRTIPPQECEQLLEMGYEIEDQEKSILRFLPQLIGRVNPTSP